LALCIFGLVGVWTGKARSGDGGTVRRGEDLIVGGFRNGVLNGFGFPAWVLGCWGRGIGLVLMLVVGFGVMFVRFDNGDGAICLVASISLVGRLR